MFRRFWPMLLVGPLLGFIAGCGSSEPVDTPIAAENRIRESAMHELKEMLDLRFSDSGKPPTRVADLARYEMLYSVAYPRVKSNELVVLFGAPIDKEASDKVLAYEKQTPESGGYVLMQDGKTIKTLTAEEFNAAPKAPGTAPTVKAKKAGKTAK